MQIQRFVGVIFVSCLAVVMACRNTRIASQFEFGLDGTGAQEQSLHSADGGIEDHTDGGSFPPSLCPVDGGACTPYNLGGRIFSGGAMWGALGNEGAESITLIGATDDIILDPSKGVGGTLQFSLIEGTVISSSYWAPPTGTEVKPIPRMEFNYDYLDATIRLPEGTPLAGDYVIRTVFVSEATASDVSGTMKRGDKLVKKVGESAFQWCGAMGCFGERSQAGATPVQEAKLVDFQAPKQGNPNYISFSVPLKNSYALSGDQLNKPGQKWTLDFDMTGAVQFHTPVEKLKTLTELLQSFELSYEPNNRDGAPTSISVTVRLE